jgi:hypothetical protein
LIARTRFITIEAFLSLAALSALIGMASADELQLPPTKEGLWESHTQQLIQNKKYETVMKICQSHEVEKSMKSVGESLRKQNQCSEVVTRQSANSYTSESHCDKGPLTGSVTKTTITYQGDTATHMELHMTNGASETVTIVDSRYLGSCPADMKPGDAVTADGTKMNLGSH